MSIKIVRYGRRIKVSNIDELVSMIEEEVIRGYDGAITIEDTSNSLGDQRNAPKFSIDNEQDYEDCIEQIRLKILHNKALFAYIKTSRNGKWSNPYYFNLLVNKLWALEVDEKGKKTVYRRVPIETAIEQMDANNVAVNEILGDVCQLEGIPAYEKLKESLSRQVSESKQVINAIKATVG